MTGLDLMIGVAIAIVVIGLLSITPKKFQHFVLTVFISACVGACLVIAVVIL